MMVIKNHPGMGAVVLIFFSALFLNSGCSHSGRPAPAEIKRYQFDRLLLLPITDSSEHHAKGETVLCELCGMAYTSEVVETGAAVFLTERVKWMLDERGTSVEIIPDEQVQAMRNRILMMKPGPKSEKELLAMIGKNLNADGILTGRVYQFRNRVGYDYGVETPAAVGFHLDLLETQNGNVIWSRCHEETQRALSENLFSFGDFFRRKGKWLTVEDLTASGVAKVVPTIPIGNERTDKKH
jgi:hypothetical protein